jgi:hypothetical protein
MHFPVCEGRVAATLADNPSLIYHKTRDLGMGQAIVNECRGIPCPARATIFFGSGAEPAIYLVLGKRFCPEIMGKIVCVKSLF